MLTAKSCLVFFIGQGRVLCKGVIFLLYIKEDLFQDDFLKMQIFQEFKESFHFPHPQVEHKTNAWPYLPHFCLPLGSQCVGTQCKRAPHKAHTSWCNVDYEFINFHGILNTKYNTIHFPLQKSFFLLVQSGWCFMSQE